MNKVINLKDGGRIIVRPHIKGQGVSYFSLFDAQQNMVDVKLTPVEVLQLVLALPLAYDSQEG